jgi:23S rRNA (guanosine2251-2'-O)-methyltransferase
LGGGPHRDRRDGRDAELLVGIHPIREALRARRRRLDRLVVRAQERAPRPELAALVELARAGGVPIIELAPDRFERLVPSDLPHQGAALEAGPLPDVDLAALGALPGPGWLVALDGIEDPRNLGAILRIAEAAGARGALLPDRRAAPLTPVVARASAGALEHLPITSVTNLTRALETLKKEHDHWVHAADPAADRDLYELPDRLLEGRLVLVLGAEGKGVRPGVRGAVDVFVRIPMAGAVESLNVSAAAAVVLFEWARRARARSRVPSGERA